MMLRTAAKLFTLVFVSLGVSLVPGRVPLSLPGADTGLQPEPAQARAERVVFLGKDLSDENLIGLTVVAAGTGSPGVVLLDAPQASDVLKAFLKESQPVRVVPVGSFPERTADLERRLGASIAPAVEWKRRPATALWEAWLPQAESVVVCPATPRGLLLQSACLAGALRSPLIVTRGEPDEVAELSRWLAGRRMKQVFAAGAAGKLCRDLADVRLTELADEEAVATCYLRNLLQKGPVRTLVLANPADAARGWGNMSALAPWVALERQAALLLTNAEGDNAAALVQQAVKKPDLQHADALILVAGLRAIPRERRPNPGPGKDEFVDIEPLTPAGTKPFTFTMGRLFHDDPGALLLTLARQRLLAEQGQAVRPRRALVVSNPGGGLPLLETFSRNTAKELHNAGYQTTALFGKEASRDQVRRLLPEQDLFLWEGHYKTLVEDYGLMKWTEPLRPSLVFLQSCLALNEEEALPLFRRGAVAVIGSSARTYSATGGAFTLAFFDGLFYDDQSLGGSLRQAKNFLLAYALLKERRLGEDARLGGVNMRSAWAFTLWGDPTLKLPSPESPKDRLAPVRHEVRDNVIAFALPPTSYERVTTGKYQAQMRPNARLAGLLSKEADEDGRRLVPFLFAEVHLPKAPADQVPRLRSGLPNTHWVFCWDQRRRCGYLLITPRPRDEKELRFQIDWEQNDKVTR